MGFTQLVQRHFTEERVPSGQEPTFEFNLDDHEEIVGVFHYWTVDPPRRKTVDHHIIVWVAVKL